MSFKRIAPKIMWFVGLWFASVLALFLVSSVLRLLMSMVGLRA
ncbi:Protein of unknown function [Kosakonia radicincitans]|nr:DUF2474 family protein [Kosakonia radicincitans]SKC21547.1 Protein of unknown function [Kosakonia radicincitans]